MEPAVTEDTTDQLFETPALVAALQQRRDRKEFLPCITSALLMYTVLLAAFIIHLDVSGAYATEAGLRVRLSSSITEWNVQSGHDYSAVKPWIDSMLAGEIVPASLSNANSTDFITIGSIRMSQSRVETERCKDVGPLTRTPGAGTLLCPVTGSVSLQPFGNSQTYHLAFQPDSTATQFSDILLPFNAFWSPHGDDGAPAFSSILNAGWLNVGTSEVRVTAAFYTQATQRWVLVQFTKTRELTDNTLVELISLRWQATRDSRTETFLDYCIVAFLCYLFGLVIVRIVRVAQLYSTSKSMYTTVRTTLCFSLFMDATLLVTLLIVVTSFSAHTTALAKASELSTTVDWLTADTSFSTQLHAHLLTAAQHYRNFVTVAVAAVFAATARVFVELRKQARIAALGDALVDSLSDTVHVVAPFGLILVAFGIWGHAVFGRQVADYRSIADSANAVMRLIMYDYDLAAMNAVDAGSAAWYFGSFMFVITNMVFWMFLAIAIDAYSTTRVNAQTMPNVLHDVTASARALPDLLASLTRGNKESLLPSSDNSYINMDESRVMRAIQALKSAKSGENVLSLRQLSEALAVPPDKLAAYLAKVQAEK